MSEAIQPLKILILLNRVPYPLNDGGAIGAFNFIRGYAEAGCEVTMLAMNTTKHFVEREKVQEVFSQYGKVETVNIDNRIKPVDALLNLFGSQSYVIQRFVSNAFAKKLTEVLSENEFDVVHVDGLPPSAYIDVVHTHSKAKIIMRAHNVEHVIWKRIVQEEKKLLKKWYLAIQVKRLMKYEINAFKQCDLVMAISREDEETIHACSPVTKTILVPAGMDIQEVLQNDNTNQLDLFFIGSFDWQPNLQGIEWFFDNVWKQVKEKFPSLQFVIAGNKMPESILNLHGGNVLIAGRVPDAKQFIIEHEIMLVPLVSGSGIRIKIVEAMALGKCIIATTIAAEGLGLTNGENILIANTAEEFVAQIEKCSDFAFRNRIGFNAHRFALENFQNRRIFEKLLTTLRKHPNIIA